MPRGAVVVTGASTGIGEATALHLAELGFRVFGAVRRGEDAERLRGASAALEPVLLDVTDETAVRAAAEQVSAAVGSHGGLAGLVNNAGVSITGPLEFIPLEELRRQLEVNVVGQVAVTQAFLPLVRRARGRIVNVGSVGGRIALPLLGPYAASKFALEAVTDSLRRELRQFGVDVVIVEPGGVVTPIWRKGLGAADELQQRMPPEAEQLYGRLIAAVRAQAQEIARNGMPPRAVAEVVATALTARRPRTRYLVGRDAKQRVVAARLLGDRRFDALLARVLSRGR